MKFYTNNTENSEDVGVGYLVFVLKYLIQYELQPTRLSISLLHIWLNVMKVIKIPCPPLMTKLSIACIIEISDMNMQIK
jgi:hypothetical protein